MKFRPSAFLRSFLAEQSINEPAAAVMLPILSVVGQDLTGYEAATLGIRSES